MKTKLVILGLLAGLAAAPLAHAGTTYNTVQSWTGDWFPFGEPNTSTYGESFTVGADNVLNSFSLYLDQGQGSSVDFKSYVYAWDGTKATGSALYASSLQTFTGTAQGNPQEFAFNVGALNLTSGGQYVAFLSDAGVQDGGNNTATMPFSGNFGSDHLSGGGFRYFNTGNNFSALTSSGWDKQGGEDDVWFKASFSSAAPEPATWALMILGFGAAGTALRRRKTALAA